MRLIGLLLVVVVAVTLTGSAFAVAPEKKVEYPGEKSPGKIIFDGKTHAEKGLKCNDCHTKIFPMKKGTKMTMADMNAGKYCGTCHNGGKAFKSSDPASCAKCHKK